MEIVPLKGVQEIICSERFESHEIISIDTFCHSYNFLIISSESVFNDTCMIILPVELFCYGSLNCSNFSKK